MKKGKTSLQISKEDFEAFDYIIGMDLQMFLTCQVMADCQNKDLLIYHLEVFQILGIQEILKPISVFRGCQAWFVRKGVKDGKS